MKRKRVGVALLSGKTVRGVAADVCPRCGERYYDLDAMRKLREARTGEVTRPLTISMCPTCGSKRIRRKSVRAPIPGGRKVRVQAEVCSDCGEQLFGMEAMRRLEAADPRYRHPRSRGRKTALKS